MPGKMAGPWPHLIHCELILGLAQLPVAGRELANEVVAAMRPWVGNGVEPEQNPRAFIAQVS